MIESVAIRRPRRGRELAVLAAAMLACLLPFADKAYHIDDTLFVWAGQHIQNHPLDFYGFNVNWYATWQPMSGVTQNPPAACYYLALVGSIFGWSEIALHLAMLLPAWGLIWGTYRLAEQFGVRPFPAALLTLFTPATLLCASSVMCDVMMTFLWVWTVILWDRGLREQRAALLYTAGCLIALTTVTKYFGLCLVPLLGVYAFAVDRVPWRIWAKALGVAVLLLAIYQGVFLWLYGQGGLAGAMGYAASLGSQSMGARLFRFFEGLGFVGGCVGVAALPTIFLVRRNDLTAISLIVIAAMIASFTLTGITKYDSDFALPDSPFAADAPARLHAGVLCQFLLWIAGGAGILLLAADDLRTHRDPVGLLLFLWIMGTALFAAYVNWALNGRSVLPLAPAVAMVLVRRLDRQAIAPWVLPVILAASAALAAAVTYADASVANANRAAAHQLTAEVAAPAGRPLWFQGHWGFQYYAQQAGARSWDFEAGGGKVGDLVVVPFNNCLTGPPDQIAIEIDKREWPSCSWLTAMYPNVGAGYYACCWDWRPLPFVFTRVPPETFSVYRLTDDQMAEAKK